MLEGLPKSSGKIALVPSKLHGFDELGPHLSLNRNKNFFRNLSNLRAEARVNLLQEGKNV